MAPCPPSSPFPARGKHSHERFQREDVREKRGGATSEDVPVRRGFPVKVSHRTALIPRLPARDSVPPCHPQTTPFRSPGRFPDHTRDPEDHLPIRLSIRQRPADGKIALPEILSATLRTPPAWRPPRGSGTRHRSRPCKAGSRRCRPTSTHPVRERLDRPGDVDGGGAAAEIGGGDQSEGKHLRTSGGRKNASTRVLSIRHPASPSSRTPPSDQCGEFEARQIEEEHVHRVSKVRFDRPLRGTAR